MPSLGGDGLAQGLDGAAVPGRIGCGVDLGHAGGAAQLFELQRLVLHGQLVAALALAVEPLQNFGCQAEGTAEQPAEQGLDHWAPPMSLNLIAAPTSSAASRPVVSTFMKVCQAVRRASRQASSRSRSSRMSRAALPFSRPR